MNNRGVIVGYSFFPESGPGGGFDSRPVRWDNGIASTLDTNPGFRFSWATAINDAGVIVGVESDTGQGIPVRWSTTGAPTQLDRIPNFTHATPIDINSAGRAVGNCSIYSVAVDVQRPVAWDGTSVVELPLPSGFNSGSASAINDVGTIVGNSLTYEPILDDLYVQFRATRWIGGSPELLPPLLGFHESFAAGMNERGAVVGYAYADIDSVLSDTNPVPVLWDGGSVTDLRPLLAPFFANATGYKLLDINDNGQIAGEAQTAGGYVGFVLTIPSPSAVAIVGVGAMVGLGRRRRVLAILR
ncbi:MAG: DUF3466 family protein [Phycisphaerales bacterium]|nr:DUF3466 family protein [Phycisphaerales bacterium]